MLRPGGRILFTTIEAAPGLSAADRRRAAGAGPSAAVTRTSYPSLLKSAGFERIVRQDITAHYRSTQQAWIAATKRRRSVASQAMGDAALEQRLSDRAEAIAAIDAGVLQRSSYSARR